MSEKADYIKETIKFETEKLKIYCAFWAGLIAFFVSVLIGNDFSNLSDTKFFFLFFAAFFLIVFVIIIAYTLLEINDLLKLLKKQ